MKDYRMARSYGRDVTDGADDYRDYQDETGLVVEPTS